MKMLNSFFGSPEHVRQDEPLIWLSLSNVLILSVIDFSNARLKFVILRPTTQLHHLLAA
jgi:hypothetical protein